MMPPDEEATVCLHSVLVYSVQKQPHCTSGQRSTDAPNQAPAYNTAVLPPPVCLPAQPHHLATSFNH